MQVSLWCGKSSARHTGRTRNYFRGHKIREAAVKLESMETKSTDQQPRIPKSKSSTQPATRPPLPRLRNRLALEKSRRISTWPTGDHRISQTKVGEGAGLPVDQGTLGPRWQSHRGAFRLRMAR